MHLFLFASSVWILGADCTEITPQSLSPHFKKNGGGGGNYKGFIFHFVSLDPETPLPDAPVRKHCQTQTLTALMFSESAGGGVSAAVYFIRRKAHPDPSGEPTKCPPPLGQSWEQNKGAVVTGVRMCPQGTLCGELHTPQSVITRGASDQAGASPPPTEAAPPESPSDPLLIPHVHVATVSSC